MAEEPKFSFELPAEAAPAGPSLAGRLARLLLGTLYVGFVFGGLLSGWVFLQNVGVVTRRAAGAGGPVSPLEQVVNEARGAVETVVRSVPGSAPAPAPVAASKPSEPAKPGPLDLTAALGQGWSGKDRLNVLLLGIDQRDDEDPNLARSDVIMVVSINPVDHSVVMMSFPRDFWVNIPGYVANRINVAHPLGGPQLVMRTIEANFGIAPTQYARINFRGFEQVVDAIGGVAVDVDRPVKDDEYPTPDYGYMRVFIAPGPQWMDGTTALEYARSRHSDNDFGRSRRQQRVLVAIRDRAADPRVWPSLLPKTPQLLSLVQKTVTTSFSPTEMVGLARLATEIDRDKITNLVFDARYGTPTTTADGAQVVIPDLPSIRAAIASAVGCSSSGAPRVEVLNGTPRVGLAKSAADLLVQKGFKSVVANDADRTDYADSTIWATSCRDGDAAKLAAELGLSSTQVRPLPPNSGQVDIRVILGRNYQPLVR